MGWGYGEVGEVLVMDEIQEDIDRLFLLRNGTSREQPLLEFRGFLSFVESWRIPRFCAGRCAVPALLGVLSTRPL